MNPETPQRLELVNKEFKTAVINMLKDLKQCKQMSIFNREAETIKRTK